MTLNADEDVAVPPGVVTFILPVVAVGGTTTLILVSVSFLIVVAATPLKLTSVAFSRLVPSIVTVIPGAPEVGLKLLMVGGLGDEDDPTTMVPLSPAT